MSEKGYMTDDGQSFVYAPDVHARACCCCRSRTCGLSAESVWVSQGLGGPVGVRARPPCGAARQSAEARLLRCASGLRVTRMYVEGVHLGRSGSLTGLVRPSWRRFRCGVCGRRAPRHDRQLVRLRRRVPRGALSVWVRYALWRVSCRRCGVRVEEV